MNSETALFIVQICFWLGCVSALAHTKKVLLEYCKKNEIKSIIGHEAEQETEMTRHSTRTHCRSPKAAGPGQ